MRRRGHGVLACMLGLGLLLAPVTAMAETSQDVRAQVAEVQSELDELNVQIEQGESRVRELQEQVDGLAQESVELQTQIIRDRDRLAEIVATSYKENADTRTLALLLSSQSMDELISGIYYAQKVSDWQAECIAQLNQDKEQLDQRMAQLSTTKDEQSAAVEELSEQREELDGLVEELTAKADQLEEEEREAARRAAEEAARKAAEEQAAREAEEKARQEALKAAREAGDVQQTPAQDQGAQAQTQETPTGGDWITCIASAYTIADNTPPGSTATASGVPLDESVPTVAMPMSMNPSRFYGRQIQISYNGMTVVATVTDCGGMGGGSRGLDLTPAVFRAFGASSADEWGLRQVSYRFL